MADPITDKTDALDVFNRIQVSRANARQALHQYRSYQVDTPIAEHWLAEYKTASRSEEILTAILRTWLEAE